MAGFAGAVWRGRRGGRPGFHDLGQALLDGVED